MQFSDAIKNYLSALNLFNNFHSALINLSRVASHGHQGYNFVTVHLAHRVEFLCKMMITEYLHYETDSRISDFRGGGRSLISSETMKMHLFSRV